MMCRSTNPKYFVLVYSIGALHTASTEACIFATGNRVNVKPCRFQDLYSYEEDCVEEQNHHMAVCDTVYASKLAFATRF